MSKTLPVAVQIYSVREDAEKDFRGTIQKIKEIGYDAVELAGLYGMDPSEVRAVLDEFELPAISAHVPIVELIQDLEGTLDKYLTVGCKYIAIPYLDETLRPGSDGFAGVLKEMERIGKACQEKGLVMLYHNHDFEFVKMENGSYGLDYIYETLPESLLQTELDTCWIKVAGEDPASYVRKYAGRCPVVHLKDFYKEGKPSDMYELIGIEKTETQKSEGVFEFRPVGHGMQDFPSILEAAAASGANWVVVEQDSSVGRTSFEAIQMSREYLRSLGW
jgi:sugar phosphate isomerase/epimerase